MTPDFEANAGVILIVDDVPDNLSLLSAALDAAGYVVLVARDGVSALHSLDHALPDLILLDAVMPGLDGFRTCELIKQRAAAASVPVIFMTGLTETAHVLRAFAAGAVDYVTKPIRPDEVLARVAAHLRTARHLAQVRGALEASGQAVLVVNDAGVILWRSARARALLESRDSGEQPLSENAGWRAWLRAQQSPAVQAVPAGTHTWAGLAFRPLAHFAGSELLLAVEPTAREADALALAARFELTAREAEVLLWAARGKTSRDIAQILAMSPRTVDKHFEHILDKLGAPSRAAAISITLNYLHEAGSV